MFDRQQHVAAHKAPFGGAGISEVHESRKGQDWVDVIAVLGRELAMTCTEVQRVLPEFLDDAPDVAIQTDFESHLQSCPDCSDLVSDLKLISSEARQLATAEEPAPRVWARIAAELPAEALLRVCGPP